MKLAAIFTLLVPFYALADLPAWDGYKPVEEIQAPFQRVVMSAVMHIETIALTDADIRSNAYKIINTDDAQKVTDKKTLDTDYMALQIETCRNQKLVKCPIFNKKSTGSGFVNNGKILYTCRHIINNWTVAAARANGLPSIASVSPAIRIKNAEGAVIYNSANTRNFLKFGSHNSDNRLFQLFVNEFDEALDPKPLYQLFTISEFVELRTDTEITQPLSLKVARIEENTPIFMSGFPIDANITLSSSSGKVTSILEVQGLIAATNLSTSGISGGMLTTSEGNVAGIVCKENNPGEKNYSSTTVDKQRLQKTWDELKTQPIN